MNAENAAFDLHRLDATLEAQQGERANHEGDEKLMWQSKEFFMKGHGKTRTGETAYDLRYKSTSFSGEQTLKIPQSPMMTDTRKTDWLQLMDPSEMDMTNATADFSMPTPPPTPPSTALLLPPPPKSTVRKKVHKSENFFSSHVHVLESGSSASDTVSSFRAPPTMMSVQQSKIC
jgi:hypothetical protein